MLIHRGSGVKRIFARERLWERREGEGEADSPSEVRQGQAAADGGNTSESGSIRVEKSSSGPVAERGGRAKYLYTLTREGTDALREIRRIHRSLWTEECELAFK
jgi:hypothetical protein